MLHRILKLSVICVYHFSVSAIKLSFIHFSYVFVRCTISVCARFLKDLKTMTIIIIIIMIMIIIRTMIMAIMIITITTIAKY